MAKKRARAKYSSKGKGDSVSKETLRAMRAERSELDKILNKLNVWATGKKVMVTIPNPNKNETNKRFIRVEGTHPAAFGPWKRPDKDTGIRMVPND
jgi:hypothetical protein